MVSLQAQSQISYFIWVQNDEDRYAQLLFGLHLDISQFHEYTLRCISPEVKAQDLSNVTVMQLSRISEALTEFLIFAIHLKFGFIELELLRQLLCSYYACHLGKCYQAEIGTKGVHGLPTEK